MEKRKRNIDMLSGLPDEVLCHILSFLPTKTSACTSVLAKRWRFLWAHVPNLEFCRDNFSSRGSERKPLRIINRVIMLHEANIVNTFKLSNVKVCAYELETLIIYAIKRRVRNLYLEFDFGGGEDTMCTLPRFLFTYKTVVDLKLVHCGVIPSSGELFLPSLKKLNLRNVDYEDDESLPHLLSGCPVLEDLTICDCDKAENSRRIIVSSSTIKTLNVDLGHRDTHLNEMLIIDAPVLIYLKVDFFHLEFVKSLRKTMTSLHEAEFTLHQDCYFCDIDCTKHGRSLEFLNCLRHVRCLKIFSANYNDSLVDIVRTDSMPKFVNLTKLEIGQTVIWNNLVKILELADNLEHLIIDLRSRTSYKEPKRVPPCMLSCLRTGRVIISHGRKGAFDIVRYILRNAQVLERMEISSLYTSDEEKLDSLQTISSFERVSKACQVALNTTLRNEN